MAAACGHDCIARDVRVRALVAGRQMHFEFVGDGLDAAPFAADFCFLLGDKALGEVGTASTGTMRPAVSCSKIRGTF